MRIETGKVQFGDDWSGIFIRGDNAMGYYLSLITLKEKIKNNNKIFDTFDLIAIESLVSLFGQIHEDIDPLKLKDIKECLLDE